MRLTTTCSSAELGEPFRRYLQLRSSLIHKYFREARGRELASSTRAILSAHLSSPRSSNATVIFEDLSPAQQLFSEEFMAVLVSFVRTGSPNTYRLDRSPVWPAYRPAERSRLVLQAARTEGLGADRDGRHQTVTEVSGCHLEEVPLNETRRYDFWFNKLDKTQN